MVYVIDTKNDNKYTDFQFNAVDKSKRAEWHSKENAYYGISCFIKDNHQNDPQYTIDRYQIVDN